MAISLARTADELAKHHRDSSLVTGHQQNNAHSAYWMGVINRAESYRLLQSYIYIDSRAL